VSATTAEVARMRAIAARLTAHDVRVVFFGGWDTRGNGLTFDPRMLVEHWDASSIAAGDWGSIGVIINGRDGIPPPLSQFQRPRCLDDVPTMGIVAAGRANHAGVGGPYRLPDGTVIPADSANRYAYGREAAWAGPTESRRPAAVHADGALAYAIREVLA
jgi:hypothetical protein